MVPIAGKTAETLWYPAASLVMLTGLPGAGKSTLLRRLYGLDGAEVAPVVAGTVVVIDSAQSRAHWAGRLRWAPARARTGVVFVTHLWRIRGALRGGRPVVAHNRGCGPIVLRVMACLARRNGAGLHLLMLDAHPEAALVGQYARGRVVAPATFQRHSRRWTSLVAEVRAGRTAPAASAHLLERATADRLDGICFGEAPAA
ncbi:AAA family ATPase [Sphaerisporangium sp. TRM90804]|uniref:AAA family ATPase n=1 Tax=Sphaerisporangium sp. TRM90804 TaxID=3031113 RepID=UPI002448686A|nr:AAA family ATPase [Sphaerisporangium sp. TRM90804]MDH2425348.1 ATP-binding protein [Sphaerisporangium sp. TRM90804]